MKSSAALIAPVALALMAAIVVSACSHSKKDEVGFVPYDKKVFDAARAEGKPILVFATADWCPPCRTLHRGALTDPGVKTALEPFARLEIDCSDREDTKVGAILDGMNISGLPTLVFIDRSGTEVERLEGPRPAQTIIAAAKKASGS
jgi:thiol:disulfide interchange protein